MDPNMAMADETSLMPQMGAGNGPAHLHAVSCTHNPCNETSVSAVSKSAAEHPVYALHSIPLERPSVAAINSRATWSVLERESPHFQPFDPLSVNLRI
jgi:hypothetical protein